MPETQKVTKQRQQVTMPSCFSSWGGGTCFTIAADRYILWILIKRKKKNSKTKRQKDRYTDRYTDRQTDKQTGT